MPLSPLESQLPETPTTFTEYNRIYFVNGPGYFPGSFSMQNNYNHRKAIPQTGSSAAERNLFRKEFYEENFFALSESILTQQASLQPSQFKVICGFLKKFFARKWRLIRGALKSVHTSYLLLDLLHIFSFSASFISSSTTKKGV